MSLLQLAVAGQVVFQSVALPLTVSNHETAAQPLFLGYPHGPKTAEFVPDGRMAKWQTADGAGQLVGKVVTSDDAWTVSTTTNALTSTFGGAVAWGDDAVYDRAGDWLMVFSAEGVKLTKVDGGFRVVTTGGKVEVKLYENYYRDHLGYFLWDKKKPLWTKPVMGWCSWMAHLQDVNEQHMKDASAFFSKHLKAYGYDTVQMDDGYQRLPQMDASGYKTNEPVSDLWTKPNAKFPSGLADLAKKIRADGMIPGIWVGLYLPVSPAVPRYVTGAEGQPLRGPWVNYAVDGLDDASLSAGYLDTFRQLKRDGWNYIKVDTLRHVLYDNYRQTPGYFQAKNESMEAAYRRVLSKIKDVWGRDIYLLACWGTIPELAGIPDGCRIGEDVGPDVASMRRTAKYIAQFHYLNNVVWHNDPDYMCFRVGVEQARAWASLLALTGCQTMVSDPLGTYTEEKLDVLRRVGPTAFVRPQNPASLAPDPELAVFHGSKQGEDWTVFGRFAFAGSVPAREVALHEVGLNSLTEYLAYDFWNDRFLGVVKGSVATEALAEGACQVIALRPLTGHPQVLGTDRHVLQGAVDLKDVKWDGATLSGKMLVGPEREWSVSIYMPAGYEPVSSTPNDQRVTTLRFSPKDGTGWKEWKVSFTKAKN